MTNSKASVLVSLWSLYFYQLWSITLNILGISDVTGNHSHSCIAMLQDGRLTFALSQERISRIKNDSTFPNEAIQTALDYTGLRLKDVDAFACGYPPPRYYRSLMQHGIFDVPRSLLNVLLLHPIVLSRYLAPNFRKSVRDPKKSNGLFALGVAADKFHFIDHHLAHVSAGYFSSGFDNALAISYGGFAPHADSRNVAGAVYRCSGETIEFLEDIPLFAAGCFFSGVTVALGFQYMAQEGKTMGLAKTADDHDSYDRIRKLTSRFSDERWTKYRYWVDYIMSPRADAFLGSHSGRKLRKWIRRYSPEQVAAAAQHLWEENLLEYTRYLQKKYHFSNLILSGGTFLNVQINSLIAQMEGVEQVFIHPHPGDGSTAIGAAVEAHRLITSVPAQPQITDTGLGVEFTDRSIETVIRRLSGKLYYKKIADAPLYAAEQLAEGKVVGWFQGREEYGPRALGHRCILGDPRKTEIKERITTSVKGRDAWIPLAPSVLAERATDFFQDPADPFMMRACRVRPQKRAEISAALHADDTARVQTVDASAYPLFRRLIEHFERLTGLPMVLSTSMNRHGEPIVHQPEEAISLFINSAIDVLVIGSFAVKKD
jgi:carbamoyltransferase